MTSTVDELRAQAAALDATAHAPEATVSLPRALKALGASLASLPEVSLGGGDIVTVGTLGEGGMGVVDLARQRSLDREVAVKRARPDAGETAAAALLAEARAMGALEHPGVIPVHALGRGREGGPVIVMKRVSGVPWRALIKDPAHPAWARLPGDREEHHLRVLARVAEALAFAHSRGWVHRDVKPENVMLGDYGEVYLLDWGLAWRAGETVEGDASQLVGTPSYIAPEMLDGVARLSPRTDVYLLGATLYEALTGSPPHRGTTVMAACLSSFHGTWEPLPEGVPRELAALCRDAMARDPAERPADAGEFRARLERYLAHRGASRIAEESARRLAALEALPRDAPPEAVGRALGACVFGFRSALREWPESPEARDGLLRALGWSFDRELARRSEGAAAEVLAELEAEGGEDAARRESLRRLRDDLAREAADVERLRREHDPRVGGLKRALMGAWLAGVTSGTLAVTAHGERAGWWPLTYRTLVASFAVAAALAHAPAAFTKVTFGGGDFGRRVGLLLGAVALSCVLAVLFGAGAGLDPHAAASLPALVAVCASLGMAATVDRRLGVSVVPALACAAAAALCVRRAPGHVLDAVAASALLVNLATGWAWQRIARGAE